MKSNNLALGFLEVYRGELAFGGIELINMIKFMAKNHRKIPVNYAIEAHKSLQVFNRFFGTESTESSLLQIKIMIYPIYSKIIILYVLALRSFC